MAGDSKRPWVGDNPPPPTPMEPMLPKNRGDDWDPHPPGEEIDALARALVEFGVVAATTYHTRVAEHILGGPEEDGCEVCYEVLHARMID